jgi:hypothetical protein
VTLSPRNPHTGYQVASGNSSIVANRHGTNADEREHDRDARPVFPGKSHGDISPSQRNVLRKSTWVTSANQRPQNQHNANSRQKLGRLRRLPSRKQGLNVLAAAAYRDSIA